MSNLPPKVEFNKKLVYYTEYYSLEHLRLLYNGWKEVHCLYVDSIVFVKMVSP